MILLPAIDLYAGKAVRLKMGDYSQMTVYSDRPEDVACAFRDAGARHVHIVDLEGARDGTTPNFETVRKIIGASGLLAEVGGGVRSLETVRRYLDIGAWRVVLGTAAVSQPGFVDEAAALFGGRVAVGVDIRDGRVAVKGWTETTELECFDFCRDLERRGIRTIICTDISRDGLMSGANLDLYRRLCAEIKAEIVASGGVASLEDIAALRDAGLDGAIVGKALYGGTLDLCRALCVAAETEGERC